MDLKAIFVEAAKSDASLPDRLREHLADVSDLEEHRFDQTYIEFLDTQIELSPRGPEWTKRLVRRHAALLPFIGVNLLRGNVRVAGACFTVDVDPHARTVVHWEEYEVNEP